MKQKDDVDKLPPSNTLGKIGMHSALLLAASTVIETTSLLLLATRMGNDGFSDYMLALAMIGALAILPNSWFRIDFMRHLRFALDRKEDFGRRIGTYLTMTGMALLIVGVGVGLYNQHVQPAKTSWVLFAGLSNWLLIEIHFVLRILGRLALSTLLDLGARVFFLLVVLLARQDPDTMIAGYGFSRLAMACCAVAFVPWQVIGRPRLIWKETVDILRMHWHIFIAMLSEYWMNWAGVLVLSVMGNRADIGAVGLAARILSPIMSTFTLLSDMTLPKLIQGEHQGERAFERAVSTTLIPVFVGASTTLALLGIAALALLDPWVGGFLPRGAFPIFAGCLPAMAWMVFIAIDKMVLIARERLVETSLGMSLAGVVKLGLSVALLPWLGPTGICVAIVLSYAAYGAFYDWRIRRFLSDVPGLRLFILPILTASIAWGSVLAGFRPIPTAVACGVGLLSSLAFLRFGGLLRAEDVARVARTGLPRVAAQVLAGLTGFRLPKNVD